MHSLTESRWRLRESMDPWRSTSDTTNPPFHAHLPPPLPTPHLALMTYHPWR